MKKQIVPTIVFVLLSSVSASAATLLVPSQYPTIQAGIDAAVNGDTVLVAPGTYTGNGNRSIDFGGKAIIVKSESGPDDCIIDCQYYTCGFYFHSGETSDSVLNGFTITNGFLWYAGGGINCSRSSPTLSYCKFINNKAENGAAISLGGGRSCPVIKNCDFINNKATLGKGGAICCGESTITSPTLINCRFIANESVGSGGAIYFGSSTGDTITSPTLINCRFIANKTAASGGAIYNSAGTGSATTSPTLINCLFADNNALFSGGAIYNETSTGSAKTAPVIINCTFSNNSAAIGGGIYSKQGIMSSRVFVTVTNSILWCNLPQEIINESNATITITYSDIYGGWQGNGNIAADPCFMDSNSDYHLLSNSPCINTGDPNYVPEPNETDLDGNPRVSGGRIDMGAYEFPFPNTPPIACFVDVNQILEAQGQFGAKITLDGSCSSDADSTPGTNDDINDFDWYRVDPCDQNNEIYIGSGQIIDCNLPLGHHTIILEVTDKSGATDSNEITVTIQDTTPPEFDLSVSPTILWPANNKMVKITPTWTATDLCGQSLEVSLVDVTMNEPGNPDDIQILDDGSIYLCATRSGNSKARIYTLTYQACDSNGNCTTKTATVTVPHDMRK